MPSNEIMVHPREHSSMNEATVLKKPKQNKAKIKLNFDRRYQTVSHLKFTSSFSRTKKLKV